MVIKLTPVKMDERASLDFRSGDTVRVWSKVVEKDGKTRLQAFEGLVLARKHGRQGTNATFTLRKTASGVGVERIFPLHSPSIDRIEVIRRGSARRAKLYYIRDKAAKEIRKKMKSVTVTSGNENGNKNESETMPTEETRASAESSVTEKTAE